MAYHSDIPLHNDFIEGYIPGSGNFYAGGKNDNGQQQLDEESDYDLGSGSDGGSAGDGSAA